MVLPAPEGAGRNFAEKGQTGLTRYPICGIMHLAFAGVAHLVERDLAKVEVASSSLVARSKKETPSVRMVFSFWNVVGRPELAASTGAKRVKSRGKGRVPANGSAIRGMPGASRASSPAPKITTLKGGDFFRVLLGLQFLLCKNWTAQARSLTEREWGNPSKVPPSHSPFLAMCGSATAKSVGSHKKETTPTGWFSFLENPFPR